MARKGQTEEFKINNRDYLIKKMVPETACYWASQLIRDIQKAKSECDDEKEFGNRLAEVFFSFASTDRKRYKEWQTDCLEVVSIKYPSGWHPFKGLDGNYPEDVEASEIMALTQQSFMFSMSGFLGAGEEEEVEAPAQASPQNITPSQEQTQPMKPFTFQSHSITGDNTSFGMGLTPSPIGTT